MSSVDVAQVFFGVPRAAGPRRLLGLGSGPVEHATIQAAESMRLRLLDAHELSATAQADQARAIIRAAAAALLNSERDGSARGPIRPERIRPKVAVPIEPVRPTPRVTEAHLTPFDRLVLAVLLSGGGWNSKTRGIITGLASSVGLDASNLRRVVLGLSKIARERGSQGIVDSAMDGVMPRLPVRSPGRVEAAIGRVSEQLSREVRGDSFGSRTRLILVAVGITLLSGLVLVRVLTAPTKDERSLAQRREVAEERVARAMEVEREEALRAPENEYTQTPATRSDVVVPAKYARPPGFQRNARPEDALMRLDRAGTYAATFADLAAHLELDPDRLAETRASAWVAGIANAAETWPLASTVQREALEKAIHNVLTHAEDDQVAARLLRALDCDPGAQIHSSLDVWRRAFRIGMLARAAHTPTMPRAVRSGAKALLLARLGRDDVGLDVQEEPFAAGASDALHATVPPLVATTGISEDGLEAWELWLAAHKTLHNGAPLQEALLRAIGVYLESGRNLAEDGDAVDVLGRLVAEIDWGPSGPDPSAVREAYGTWLNDGRIPSNSSWVLASLLDSSLRVPWFRPEFVPSPEAGLADRRRVAMLALGAWPEKVGPVARGNHVLVAASTIELFDTALERLRLARTEAGQPIERMRVLLGVARLAESGALAADGREEEALAVLMLVDRSSLSGGNDVEDASSVVGRVGKHPDGVWAKAFGEASGNKRNQLEVLQELRKQSFLASDLGILDAAVFADAVWRGKSAAIRSTARALVLEEFLNGPRVALELLDRSDRAALNSDSLEFVEAFTGESMPAKSANDVQVRLRLALARKVLRLHDARREPIDRLAEGVRTALSNRARVMDPSIVVPLHASLEDVATTCVEGVRTKAVRRLFADPFPASIESLDAARAGRSWLAVTQPQRLTAALVAELDFLAYVVAADIPSVRGEVAESLQRGAAARDRASTAVLQAIETLLEIAGLERMRLQARMRGPLEGAS
jgi:hypothetical protein